MAEDAKKEVSLLKEARDVLRTLPPSARREALAHRIDRLQEAYDIIKVSCTRSAIRHMIGSATVLCVALDAVSTPPPNPPKADAVRETRHDEAVAPDRMIAY
jgi:hypothetical protein